MRNTGKRPAVLSGVRRLIADEGFTVSLLAAVIAAAVLAFGFGAEADIVVTMLVLGAVTAAEARLQRRR